MNSISNGPQAVNPDRPRCSLCGTDTAPLERLDSGAIVCVWQRQCWRNRYQEEDRREPLDAEQLSRMTGRTA